MQVKITNFPTNSPIFAPLLKVAGPNNGNTLEGVEKDFFIFLEKSWLN
jgi:hypothetical protein